MSRGWGILFIWANLAWAADPAVTAAQAALDSGDFARAAEQAESAAGSFHARHDTANEALALNIAGSAHLNRGEYDLALERYQSALALDRAQHDTAGEVTRLTNIGSVEFFRGRYLEAQAEYQKALGLGAGDRQFVLANLATLYDQLGENEKALDCYRQALALGKTARLLEGMALLLERTGTAGQTLDAFDAALSFGREARILEEEAAYLYHGDQLRARALQLLDEAVAAAKPRDAALAHLYRGEALYRLGHDGSADFRAAGDNWLALWRLGDIEKAVATRGDELPVGFFPRRRALYEAAAAGMTDPNGIFPLWERAHGIPGEPAALSAVQARLETGSLLVEYVGDASLWATKTRAGVGRPDLIGVADVMIVADSRRQDLGGRVSYLPYASFLLRDEPWRTSLMPWAARSQTITSKAQLYGHPASIVILNGAGFADAEDPNRAHLVVSATESLYRGEIQALPLGMTDLVVLSAPDPTFILSRAFLAAGARSVASGIRAGAQEKLLALLKHGASKAEAVHAIGGEAVLMGDGQQPARPVLSWWCIAAPVFAAGAFFGWWTRRRKR